MSAYARRRARAASMMGVNDTVSDDLEGVVAQKHLPEIIESPCLTEEDIGRLTVVCRICNGCKRIPFRNRLGRMDARNCDNCDGMGWVESEGLPPPPPAYHLSLNVSGTMIQVNRDTVLALGLDENKVFIDRDMDDFRDILFWVRTGNVRRVSKEAFLEAYFWKFSDMMSELIRRRCDLTFLNFSGMDLSRVNFFGADLSYVLMDKDTKLPSKMVNVKFDNVDLSGMNFVKYDFRGADFSKAIITGCDFTDALFDEKTKFRSDGDFTGTKFVRCDLRSWSSVQQSILTNADFSYSLLQNGQHQPSGAQGGFHIPKQLTGVSFHGAKGLLLVHYSESSIFKNCDISSYGKSLHIGYHGQTEVQVWSRIRLEGKTLMQDSIWDLGIRCDFSIECDVKGTTFGGLEQAGRHILTKLPVNLTGCTFNGPCYLPPAGDYILEKCVFTGNQGSMSSLMKSSDRFAGSVFENARFDDSVWEHDGKKRDFRNVVFKGSFNYSHWSRVFNMSDLSGASFKEASNMFHLNWKRNWTNVNLSQVDFSNCQLGGEDFSKSLGIPKSFEKANLTNAVFNTEMGKTKTKSLKHCNFKGANLEGVKMLNCDLTGCDFTDCNMKDVDFSYSILKNVKAMDKTKAMQIAKLKAVNFECCVCFSEDDEIVKLAPCNHSECCITCVLKMMTGKENHCPICRGEVTGWNKL